MINEDDEIIKIEEVDYKLLKKINYYKKIGLILAKMGICIIGYASSFTLSSVSLNEETLNDFQNIGVSGLSMINFITSSIILKNIKKDSKHFWENNKFIDIDIFFKQNRNIILLSFLYGITGITMNELINICQIEEIKNNLYMMGNSVMPLSLILYFYGNNYFESFNKNNGKIYKK